MYNNNRGPKKSFSGGSKVFRKTGFKKFSTSDDHGYDSGSDDFGAKKVFRSSGFKAASEHNSFNKDRGFSRKSFSSSRGSGRSFSSSRGSRGGRGKAFIDEKMFINKAVPQEADTFVPENSFADFAVNQPLKDNIIQKGYVNPSPIQDKAIPLGLTGRDIIGIANTGTGKTAAFLIPIIDAIYQDKKKKAIILAPTRELAQQIEAEFISFAKGLGIYSAVCVGGAPIFSQISKLNRGVNLVIGTPGRVQDLIDRRKIRTSEYCIAVLDEADRMLDMGFVDEMRAVLHAMAPEKQSFFFSATFSPEIRNLCGEFLNNPEVIEIKSRETSSNVDQDVVRVARGGTHKIDALHDILIQPEATKVIVFSETKRSVDDLSEELIQRGFRASALHGDMRNRAREGVVRDLKSGRIQVVVATDVAARGIDIKDISHVINYEIPNNYETYVHRIGRTGRAGQAGKALTFVYTSAR